MSSNDPIVSCPGPGDRLVLRGGRLADGRLADVAIDPAAGSIVAVGVVGELPTDVEEDCAGLVIIPSAVEVHAHLDKALSSAHSAMPIDLDTAIEDWHRHAAGLGSEDFAERATVAAEAMVLRGTTTIRTHVDVSAAVGLRAVEALISVRDRMRRGGFVDIEIVALAAAPQHDADRHAHRRLLEAAVELGVDVIGGSPDVDPDPLRATEVAVAVAAESGLPIDLHTDQSVDPKMFYLPDYVRLVERHGIVRSAASHCVSLASQSVEVQRRTAATIASVGMSVFTMPLTSLFYFGWDTPIAPQRGVTSIHELLDNGVNVAAGADNVRDAFFPLGRFDPFETATVLAMVAHLSPEQAWSMCSSTARDALGLPVVDVAPGCSADLVAVAGTNISNAVAAASERRTVLHRGRIVAKTTTCQQVFN